MPPMTILLLTICIASFVFAQPHANDAGHHVHHLHHRRSVVDYFTRTLLLQFNSDHSSSTRQTSSSLPSLNQDLSEQEEDDSSSYSDTLLPPPVSLPQPGSIYRNYNQYSNKIGVNRNFLNGVNQNFPDGVVDCTHFPIEYGAVPLYWVTKSGWSGIQANGGNYDHVGICREGDFCSYACPPGYSKAQWPPNQPASGESHGGLLCKNGKLYKTRNFPRLCDRGFGGTTVVNQLNQFVAICRTDYPGSENMVVPLPCTPGSNMTLTVPEADTSYHWQGKPSSAQYYVNHAGVPLEQGCVWGTPQGGKGNWSPIVIGAGYSCGKTWLSISQNSLNPAPLNYNIKIIAGPGSRISGECRYENGKFYGVGGVNSCTVALDLGTAQYVLY